MSRTPHSKHKNDSVSERTARVCAVIAEETVASARRAIEQAAELADMIEVRLDYLRDFDFTNPENLRSLLEDRSLPAIITCRAVEEGGHQSVNDSVRLRLLAEGARRWADYCDIEALHYDQAFSFSPDPSRLIVSYHNFVETPYELDDIYDRVSALPASIHKIATRARDVSDQLAIFRLLDRAQSGQRRLIALAMGERGAITRLLGPSRGSFLTYGTIRSGRESAPGQLSCEELNGLYRVHQLSRNTSITGIIGNPVSHSASPAMHNAGFQAEELDFVYLPIEATDVEEFFARFVRPSSREMDWPLRGFSVTIPHKTTVVSLLDDLDETARQAGAVNTVVINDGRATGYNTDVQGAMEPLERACALKGESCAVIGAGGAARAVIYGLLERGARVTVFARDPVKARPLADRFGIAVSPVESLASSDARIVINTTPVGMRGASEGVSPVSADALANSRIAYDLVYNPVETRFLKEAKEKGCRTISGIEMIIAQAALQFELWTGRKAPLDLFRSAAFNKVAESEAG